MQSSPLVTSQFSKSTSREFPAFVSDNVAFGEDILTGIRAISIDRAPLVIAGGGDVDVPQNDLLAFPHMYSPELGLNERQTVHRQILGLVECHRDWTARLVGSVAVLRVPSLAIAVVKTTLLHGKGHVLATKKPCRVLVLIDDPYGVGEPVRYVCRESELALENHITIHKAGGVEDLSDVVNAWLDYHAAVFAALVESLLDVRGLVKRRVGAVVYIWIDVAVGAIFHQPSGR